MIFGCELFGEAARSIVSDDLSQEPGLGTYIKLHILGKEIENKKRLSTAAAGITAAGSFPCRGFCKV